MPPILRPPKKLLDALKDKGVTLKHLQIRRQKRLITPAVEAGKIGTSNKYGARDALMYVSATLLEEIGYSMEKAYEIAGATIDGLHIVACLTGKNEVWIIQIEGGKDLVIAMNMAESINMFDTKQSSDYVKSNIHLIPAPGILLCMSKDDFLHRLGGKDVILNIEYRNLSAIMQDAFSRLKMGFEERKEFFKGKIDLPILEE